MASELTDKVTRRIGQARFFMLRYETELTPCTGITAVSKQERRHFNRGITVAPWCPNLERDKPEDDPINNGTVQDAGLQRLQVNGAECRVLTTTGELAPIFFLAIEGRFLGKKTPYDIPLSDLRTDTLYFGIAVNELLKRYASSQQFVWGADWESVPALCLVRDRHHISLTLHNTFDECLAQEARTFGATFQQIMEKRGPGESDHKTALEVGLEIADVATTVNRGFAYGMRQEPIQRLVMARHLQHLLTRVVGINNAAFSPPKEELRELCCLLENDLKKGSETLFRRKVKALDNLPEMIRDKAKHKTKGSQKGENKYKVIVVSMGRRVAQKQHDVFVESVRKILKNDPDFPLLAVFATVPGDAGSDARLERMKALQEEFPANVVCDEERISYFGELMAAADYNCMPSLYEPHGGAFEGTVVPIARAVDGLAEQICGLDPTGIAKEMNALWHTKNEPPTGFLFREHPVADESILSAELASLLETSPSPDNKTFRAMRDALCEVLHQAVALRTNEPEKYTELALAALQQQEDTSWHINLGGMLALMEQARQKRGVA